MTAVRTALCALLCVLALALVCASDSLLHRHPHHHHLRESRRLAAQAEDDAACATAVSNSPFAAYLTAIPETGGLRMCASANINDLVAALSTKDSKCQLTTLVSLFSSSSTDKDVSAFMELLSALLSGLTATTSSASPSASTASSSLASFLASWTKDATKMQGFCSVMNTKVGPCVQTLVPALLALLRKGPKCCNSLAQYADVLNLLVPAGKSAEQMLFDLLNGFHATMCTTVAGSDALCGQNLLAHLSTTTADSSAKSLLTAVLFDAGLPLYALPDAPGTCAALDAKTVASRIVRGASIPYFSASCCAVGLASLLEAVDAPLARLTGNTVAETLNLITAKQSAPKTAQFHSFYDELKQCTFAATCAAPAFVLPSNLAIAATESSAGLTAKTVQPKGVACTKVDVCDADKVCSSVCKPGSVKIAPWVSRALSFQRNQSYDKSLCFTQLPGTHNSATTLARGYGNRDQLINKVLNPANANSYMRTNNQFLSLEDQLRIGARFLEIDVHYFGGAIRSGHCSSISLGLIQDASTTLVAGLTSILSGGASASASSAVTVEWDASLFGCLPSLSGIRAEEQRLHSESLQEVAAWLKSNPTELVVLYTEIGDELPRFGKTAALLQLYSDAFGDLIFTPADLKAKGGAWTEFTLSELIGAGKRVILVTTPKENDLMFKMTTLCGGWSDIPGRAVPSGATTLWGKKYNTGSLVRAYYSALRYATLSESDLKGGSPNASLSSSSTDPTDVTSATIPAFVNAGVNIVAPDGLDGATMEAMVWSWAAKEPSSGDIAVEVAAKDGRWYGVADKSTIQNIACVSSSDRSAWKVVAQGTVCPSGFVAGTPVLAVENAALVAVLRTIGASATAQLSLDISKFPVISAAEEKEFESTSNSPGGSPGSSSGGSTPTTASAGHSVARGGSASSSLWFSAIVAIWIAAARAGQ